MNTVNRYRAPEAWQFAMQWANEVSAIPQRFREEELYGMKELEMPMLSCEIGLATQPVIEAPVAVSDRIGRMLRSWIRSIQTRK